jgi:hypothetical protein
LAARPSDIFVYPQHPAAEASQDCYDMPRSLHQTLIRQDSSNYQAPRSHRSPPPAQSAIQNVAAFADYDVPRPHHNRIQPVRTPSVDSRYYNFNVDYSIRLVLGFTIHYEPLFSMNGF